MEVVSDILILYLFLVLYYLIYKIDIPNLQIVDLPNSFQSVQSKSITSICMNMNE